MCTIFFAYKCNKDYPFIYFGNRDEFYKRPTQRAIFFDNILMGRDLEKGGTWFGLEKSGKLGFLTNYRDMSNIKDNASTRGHLITDYLRNNTDAVKYLDRLKKSKLLINDYNLVIGDLDHLHYYSSIRKKYETLNPGIYGLSNAYLNTAWYKVTLGKEAFASLEADVSVENLFELLDNKSLAKDELLPKTKLPYDAEKALSALHVDFGGYGTVYKQVFLYDGATVNYYDKYYEDNFKSIRHYEFKVGDINE